MEHAKCEESPADQDPEQLVGKSPSSVLSVGEVSAINHLHFGIGVKSTAYRLKNWLFLGRLLLKFVETSIWHVVQQKRREPMLPWVHHPTSWGSKWKRKAGEGRRKKVPFLPPLWTRHILFCCFFCIQCYSVCSLWGLLKPYTLAYTRKFLHTTPVEGWCNMPRKTLVIWICYGLGNTDKPGDMPVVREQIAMYKSCY